MLNQAKNIPVVLSSSPIKIRSKSVKGFMIYDRRYKQTDKQRLLLYIDVMKRMVCLSLQIRYPRLDEDTEKLRRSNVPPPNLWLIMERLVF